MKTPIHKLSVPDAKNLRAKYVAAMEKIHASTAATGADLSAEDTAKFDRLNKRADAITADLERREKIAHYDRFKANGGTEGRRSTPLPHQAEKRHQYSIMKAMRQSLEAREGKGKLDGLELETHQALNEKREKPATGILIPLDLVVEQRSGRTERRALDVTTGAGGIQTVVSTTMIDILRKKLVTAQMGATFLNDMVGNFAIPRQSGAATGYWFAEGGAPTASNQTIDQVAFAPKTVGAYTDYTRKFMLQTGIAAENFARADIMAVLARALDLAGLFGTGTSNQPTGLAANSAVPTVAMGTNGAAPTWASIVALESAVAIANADEGSLGYVTSAKVRGKLKTTVKDSNTAGVYLMPESGLLNSYPTLISNQMPDTLTKGSSTGVCSSLMFGNWADLIISLWSGIDVLVDPYTGSSTGNVRIVAMQDADVNVRHPESFAKTLDILAA